MSEISIRYFASLAEKLGCREEHIAADILPCTVAELRVQIAQRGGQWQALDAREIKTAINHDYADEKTVVHPGDEIAFFPPVTGG